MGKKKGPENCKLCARLGREKCNHHNGSVDLAARNRKVAEAAKENDPQAYLEKCQRGAATTQRKYGEKFFNDKARAKRLAQPSRIEQEVKEVLDKHGYEYLREIYLSDDTAHTCDFLIGGNGRDLLFPLWVEVDGIVGRRYRELTNRDERMQKKERLYQELGLPYVILRPQEKTRWLDIIDGAIEEYRLYG